MDTRHGFGVVEKGKMWRKLERRTLASTLPLAAQLIPPFWRKQAMRIHDTLSIRRFLFMQTSASKDR